MLMWVLYVLLFLVIMRVGLFFIRKLAQPLPPPLPPGEMRRVNIKYRREMCGAEVKMTVAAEHEPDPPRHWNYGATNLPARLSPSETPRPRYFTFSICSMPARASPLRFSAFR